MFYPTNMNGNNRNSFENPFCIFLMDNLHMTCHSSICLHYKKMVRMIDINYFLFYMNNQYIHCLFCRLGNKNTYTTPMNMYYTYSSKYCMNYSNNLSNKLHSYMQCQLRKPKLSRHCGALLIHKSNS